MALENLYVITMDYKNGKSTETEQAEIDIESSAKLQLMKKVIVKMSNDTLHLNFHPQLAALAKTNSLKVRVNCEIEMPGKGKRS